MGAGGVLGSSLMFIVKSPRGHTFMTSTKMTNFVTPPPNHPQNKQ